jgi:8-oxo-dGTP diphosphatase
MTIHDEFVKYPTGKIDKGEWCECCGRFNSRNITCSVISVRDNSILMVKRVRDPMKDYWAIPGGYLDWDETLEECAVRELHEETGYRAKNIKFFGVYSDPARDLDGRQNVDHCFVAEVDEKQDNYDKVETAEMKWYSLDKLPSKLAFDHGKMIEDYGKTLK